MTATIYTGKKLATSIKGFGAKAATFSAELHNVAASALNHVEVHNCASHLNNLYAALPLNYRGSLRIWATALGKVTFAAEPEVAGQFFAYAKGSKSDMAKAIEVSPAEFQRDKGAETAPAAFNEFAELERFLGKLIQKGASKETLDLLGARVKALRVGDEAAKAAIKAAKLDKALSAKAEKPAKAPKAAPVAANVEPAPVAAPEAVAA